MRWVKEALAMLASQPKENRGMGAVTLTVRAPETNLLVGAGPGERSEQLALIWPPTGQLPTALEGTGVPCALASKCERCGSFGEGSVGARGLGWRRQAANFRVPSTVTKSSRACFMLWSVCFQIPGFASFIFPRTEPLSCSAGEEKCAETARRSMQCSPVL